MLAVDRHGDDHDDHGSEQRGRVLHGIGGGEDNARAHQKNCPGPALGVGAADAQPRSERQQEQRHRVVGREGTQELRARQGGEQGGSQKCCPLPVQPGCRAPQKSRDPEHEAQREDARGGQATHAIGEGAERRVHDRCPREVRREVRDRRAMQPPCPLQMPGPQVESLVLECRVGPQEPYRQGRLDQQHRQQWPRPGRQARPTRPVPCAPEGLAQLFRGKAMSPMWTGRPGA